jgi:Zn-finger nucleic acid-binding protein
MKCCRCGTDLASGTFHGVPLKRCAACEGLLVEVRHNVPLLEALRKDLAAEVDLHAEIEAHTGCEEPATCPGCSSRMERFGYMGTNRVFLDRCGRCLLLWIDGDEVVTLTMVYARTQARGDDRRAFYAERAKELEATAHRVVMARIMAGRGFSGF